MRPALLRLAMHYTEDPDEAEDIIQDVLLKLWFLRERLDDYRSIDALAVGVSFAFLAVDIWTSALAIGVTTFVLSFAGVKVGNIFGAKYKSKAELAGGIILILIGLKILLEHTVFA